jgi:hypothetical protein
VTGVAVIPLDPLSGDQSLMTTLPLKAQELGVAFLLAGIACRGAAIRTSIRSAIIRVIKDWPRQARRARPECGRPTAWCRQGQLS